MFFKINYYRLPYKLKYQANKNPRKKNQKSLMIFRTQFCRYLVPFEKSVDILPTT